MIIDRDVNSYFERVIECINSIHKSDMYDVNEKENLNNVKKKIEYWYNSYLKSNTLKEINPNDIEYMDLKITVFLTNILKLNQLMKIILKDYYIILVFWRKNGKMKC